MKTRTLTSLALALAGTAWLWPSTGRAVTPTESELADAARWAAARFTAVAAPAFSFNYGGKSFAELPWKPVLASRKLDDHRTEHTMMYTDDPAGLQVRCVAVEYHDFPTLEWTVYFTNRGTNDTPILSDIQALDARFQRTGQGEFVLHHHKGTFVRADDFEPLTTKLGPGQRERFAPPGGRPCGHVWPYFNGITGGWTPAGM